MSNIAQISIPVEPIWLPASYSNSMAASVQGIVVRRDGLLDTSQDAVTVPLGRWNRNSSADVGDEFEVMMSFVSGTWLGRNTDVWLGFAALAVEHLTWLCNGIPLTSVGILRIRRLGSTVTLRSCPITLTNHS
jgi:hypothetical protein